MRLIKESTLLLLRPSRNVKEIGRREESERVSQVADDLSFDGLMDTAEIESFTD